MGSSSGKIEETDEAEVSLQEQHLDLQRILGENLRQQELTRTRFTNGLLVVFALVIVFALGASLTPYWPNAKDALLITLPAVSGFVGFAVGFYYLTVFSTSRDR